MGLVLPVVYPIHPRAYLHCRKPKKIHTHKVVALQ